MYIIWGLFSFSKLMTRSWKQQQQQQHDVDIQDVETTIID